MDWVTEAVNISGCDCCISYETVMSMGIIEISMVRQALLARKDRLERDMKRS